MFLTFCDNFIDRAGAGGVASLMDVIPWHIAQGHELGDGLFLEGKGGCPHGTGSIVGARRRCAVGFLAEICGNLVRRDEGKLVTGERWRRIIVHPVDEGREVDEALGVCFSCL